MKVDQPTNEVKGSGGTTPPALEAHLADVHGRVVQLGAISRALELLLDARLGGAKVASELAAVVVGYVMEIEGDLDGVSIERASA